MTTLREAAQQALKALESRYAPGSLERCGDAITALWTALEQQQAEPAALKSTYHPCTSILIEGLKKLKAWDVLAEWDRARGIVDERLNSATKQQQVGPVYRKNCTECERAKQVQKDDDEWKADLAKGRKILAQQSDPGQSVAFQHRQEQIEKKMAGVYSAFSATHPALEQQAEPVAWQVMVEDEAMKEFPIKDMAHDWCVQQKLFGSSYVYWIRPLYTAPPQRKPLTKGEIEIVLSRHYMYMEDLIRAIEAAHDIK